MFQEDYDVSKQFWNKNFSEREAVKVEGKWIEEESFNTLLKSTIKAGDCVLDFGCGSGWALIELFFTIPIKEGIGLDQSVHAINLLKQTAQLSNLNSLSFICGDDTSLEAYPNHFDCIISINVIDVIPDEVIDSILKKLKNSMKDQAYLLIGINPDYPFDLLQKMGYQKVGHYLYKDNIFRGNEKTITEWTALFKKHFQVVEFKEFTLQEKDRVYPRRMFILQK